MLKKLKLKKQIGSNLEPQEIILDRLVQAKKGKYDQSSKLERPIQRRGIQGWAWLSIFIWLILLAWSIMLYE